MANFVFLVEIKYRLNAPSHEYIICRMKEGMIHAHLNTDYLLDNLSRKDYEM